MYVSKMIFHVIAQFSSLKLKVVINEASVSGNVIKEFISDEVNNSEVKGVMGGSLKFG